MSTTLDPSSANDKTADNNLRRTICLDDENIMMKVKAQKISEKDNQLNKANIPGVVFESSGAGEQDIWEEQLPQNDSFMKVRLPQLYTRI